MSSDQGQKNNNQLTERSVQRIIDAQLAQINLQEKRIQLEEKQIEKNFQLSKLSIEKNAEFLQTNGKNIAKVYNMFLIYFVVVLLIVLSFSVYCLHNNHDELLKYLWGGFFYLISCYISYRFGRAKNTQQIQ